MRMVEKKNIALCIVLSIVTCGIYSWFWLFSLAEDVNAVTRRPEGTSGGLVVVFSLLTCGIYTWYWLYKSGDQLDALRAEQGRAEGHLGILFLLLSIFGFGIISSAIMQSELNEYAGV